jgi:hypothetical protein
MGHLCKSLIHLFGEGELFIKRGAAPLKLPITEASKSSSPFEKGGDRGGFFNGVPLCKRACPVLDTGRDKRGILFPFLLSSPLVGEDEGEGVLLL